MKITCKNFEEVANVLGFKVKRVEAKKKGYKCPKCDNDLQNIPGTNVWLCHYASLSDGVLKNGTEVQVFTPCRNMLLADA